ncbi:MAG: hypothetical protein K2N64_03510, partial [Anaeroplasmataceae bacterium]|nr:hypothetical protein [Anaeroplasmataceae bacterium]
MANKGLKSYTKQISQTIGDVAKGFVNVNKDDANMHILIPLFQTLGPNPLDLSLIWNYQDRDRIGHFGKGFRLDTYKNIKERNSTIVEVLEADGSILEFEKKSDGKYYNFEMGITLSKGNVYIPGDGDCDIYSITDQQGNHIDFNEGFTYYPSEIQYKNGFRTTFDRMNMDNGYGAKITFTERNRFQTSAAYTQDGIGLCDIEFEYDTNERLISVKYYKESTMIKYLSITYGLDFICLKDEISHIEVRYGIKNNQVIYIEETIHSQLTSKQRTEIEYENRKTTVKDALERKVYYYFDEHNFPLFEIDDEGNARQTKYEADTKRLISRSENLNVNRRSNEIEIVSYCETNGAIVNREEISIEDKALAKSMGKVYRVSGTGGLSYELLESGNGNREITVVIWARGLEGEVEVNLCADRKVEKKFQTSSLEMMVIGLRAIKSHTMVTLTIKVKGVVDLGTIQVLEQNYMCSYSYDQQGNLLEAGSRYGNMKQIFNSSGQRAYSFGTKNSVFGYEYDECGNVLVKKTGYGGKIEMDYNEKNQKIKQAISDTTHKKQLERNMTYDKWGLLDSELDELGYRTSYSYDRYGRMISITNALSHITEYSYDNYDRIKQITSNHSAKIEYSYDEEGRMTSANLSNGTTYNYEYDQENNLVGVEMNGQKVVSYSYDAKTGMLLSQSYGENGDSFDFVYNQKQNLEKIKINGVLKYEYIYDSYEQLKEVKNGNGGVLQTYTYDTLGKMTNRNENGSEVYYEYDCAGELLQRSRSYENKSIQERFDRITATKSFTPDNMIWFLQSSPTYLGTLFNQDSVIKNANYGYKPINYKTQKESEVTYVKRGRIPCVYCGLVEPISYTPYEPTLRAENSGAIGFWHYLVSFPATNQKKYLFSIKHPSLNSYIAVYINSTGHYVLEMVDVNNTVEIRKTENILTIGAWHYFGLNYEYREDGMGYGKQFSYELHQDGEKKVGTILNKSILTGGSSIYHIGYRFNGANGYQELNGYITGLMISYKGLVNQELDEYYHIGKDYIEASEQFEGEDANYSATTLSNLTEEMTKAFEIYPLQNSVKSLSGKSPIAFDVRNVSTTDWDRSFDYNFKLHHFAYVADEKGKLEYSLSFDGAGVLFMRAFIRETVEKQYFLELKDSKNRRLGLYRGTDEILYIDHNGTALKTALKFSSRQWHSIALSFTKENHSDSVSTLETTIVRIYLDGQSYNRTLLYLNYEPTLVSIGKRFSGENPLCGQIEKLAIREAYCEVATLDQLSEEAKDFIKESAYDELGMKQRETIYNSDKEILSKSLTYKEYTPTSNRISTQPQKETIRYGTTSLSRSYETDDVGNVIAV